MINFCDDAIIICNNNIKNKILKDAFKEKRLFNYTFYSVNNFKEKYYYKITKEAYIYASKFLNLSYQNSKLITPAIYYIDLDNDYNDSKLKQLQLLKKALKENNLLEFDSLFHAFLLRKKLYIYQRDLDYFTKAMIDELSKIIQVNYFDFEAEHKIESVLAFDKYEEEIEYVFTQIRKLLDQKIDINKIFIVNTDKNYNHIINRYASLFNIPVKMKEQTTLSANKEVKKFITGLKNHEPIVDLVGRIYNDDIKKIIINLINEYASFGNEILIAEIMHKTFETDLLTDIVNVCDLDYGFNDDDYVFVINFSNGNIPKIFLDDNYLSDKYQNILKITPTEEKNKKARNDAIYILSTIKNKYLSYSLKTTEEKAPSSLIRVLNLKVIKGETKHNYSEKIAKINYGKEMDNYYNYGIISDELKTLNASLDNLYQKYDNQFSWVDKDLLHQKLNGKIKLSYSSVSNFFKCNYYFYLNNILRIPYIQDKSAADIGTAFHDILEYYHSDNFNLEEQYQEKLASLDNDILKHYFTKLWPDFLTALEFIDKMSEYTLLSKEKHENEVTIDFSDGKWNKIFTGFIDKIIYEQIDGVDYLAIIDYKTGNTQSSSLDNVIYGFNLQLPVYAYLILRSKLFDNPQILGIYLHYIYAEPKLDKNKSVEEAKWNALKLDGYSINDKNLLKILDASFADSKMIKSLKTKTDGEFGANARVLSKDDFIKLVNIVDKLLRDAFALIEEGNFKINPKYINQKNNSCTYCHYQDICYKRYDNKVDLKEQKIKDILGGE